MGTFLVPIRGVRLRWRSQVTAARFALHGYVYTSLAYECAFPYTSFVSIIVFFVHEPGHACHVYAHICTVARRIPAPLGYEEIYTYMKYIKIEF